MKILAEISTNKATLMAIYTSNLVSLISYIVLWCSIIMLFFLGVVVDGSEEHVWLHELIVKDDHVLSCYHVLQRCDFLLKLLDILVFSLNRDLLSWWVGSRSFLSCLFILPLSDSLGLVLDICKLRLLLFLLGFIILCVY